MALVGAPDAKPLASPVVGSVTPASGDKVKDDRWLITRLLFSKPQDPPVEKSASVAVKKDEAQETETEKPAPKPILRDTSSVAEDPIEKLRLELTAAQAEAVKVAPLLQEVSDLKEKLRVMTEEAAKVAPRLQELNEIKEKQLAIAEAEKQKAAQLEQRRLVAREARQKAAQERAAAGAVVKAVPTTPTAANGATQASVKK